jgi:hypothetical protein
MFRWLPKNFSSVSLAHHQAAKSRRNCARYDRRLRAEPLEDRRLLTITVDTLVDGIGVPGTSLREAIQSAAPSETINFSVTGTINLTVGATNSSKHLVIDKSLNISGPGANLLTIKAFDPTPAQKNGDGSRVLYIHDGNNTADKTVTISGLTLTGGDIGAAGGAIATNENLTVTDSVISGNTALDLGGGIYAAHYGFVSITGSTISGNTTNNNRGGGIYNKYCTLTLTSSTISGNRADSWGGGVFNNRGAVTIAHSTITGNQTDINNDPHFNITGGGIYSDANGSVTLRHTIVAGNTGTGGARDDISGPVAAQYCLIGDRTGATITNQGGNQIGTAAAPINPLLGPLANNGGRTMTHALLTGSPAIDRGNPAAAAGVGGTPLYDQRGSPFTRVFNGDGASGAQIDIGAFEMQSIPPATVGDYNRNNRTDAPDYVLWRKTLNANVTPLSGADGDGDGRIDQDDLVVWKSHFDQSLAAGGGLGEAASDILPQETSTLADNHAVAAVEPQPAHLSVEKPGAVASSAGNQSPTKLVVTTSAHLVSAKLADGIAGGVPIHRRDPVSRAGPTITRTEAPDTARRLLLSLPLSQPTLRVKNPESDVPGISVDSVSIRRADMKVRISDRVFDGLGRKQDR